MTANDLTKAEISCVFIENYVFHRASSHGVVMTGFPQVRMRRNRRTEWARRLVAENRVGPADLILPIILVDGSNRREPIETMPGVARLTIDLATEVAAEAAALGIPALAL